MLVIEKLNYGWIWCGKTFTNIRKGFQVSIFDTFTAFYLKD